VSLKNYTIDELHIAKGAISDNIYAGFLDTTESHFMKKKDITGEFMKAVVDKFAGYEEVFTLDGKKYRLKLTEIEGEE
jgi:hypothetical protein